MLFKQDPSKTLQYRKIWKCSAPINSFAKHFLTILIFNFLNFQNTYRKKCFSQVALFLQQLVNILGDDLKKKSRKGTESDILTTLSDGVNILPGCWYKYICERETVYTCEQGTSIHSHTCHQKYKEMLLKTPICPLVFVRTRTTWKSLVLYCTCVGMCVCLCVQYSQTVEVESARRGNLLYMQRADVSCVYPCSHSTKESCIQSHSYPRPSLSWFSDISNVLFPFSPFLFPSFQFFPLASCSTENRQEHFVEQILILDQVWKTQTEN